MNSTLTALAAAIIDNPADRTVRLVYADALDESGDPTNAARAEFIRAQVALEVMSDDDPQRFALVNRCDDLFAENWIDWWSPVCAAVDLPEPYVPKHRLRDRVRRFVSRDTREIGMPYQRTTDNPGVYSIRSVEHGFTAQFIAGFPELLYFPDTPLLLNRWATAVPLSRIRWVGNGFNDESWEQFNGPHLTKVSELILERLPPEAATLIAQSEHLANLTSLKVLLLRPADVVLRELLTHPTWTGLRSLTLLGVTPPSAIQTLAERCELEELESLTLGIRDVPEPAPFLGLGGAIGAMLNEMMSRLLSAFPLPPGPIRWTDYWPALIALARSPVLPRLRKLQLQEATSQVNPFETVFASLNPDEAPPWYYDSVFPRELVKALADGLNVDKLERLELPRARLSDEGRAELTARFGSRVVLV
jgi:uncharacterized protein (TIGR02996 family)